MHDIFMSLCPLILGKIALVNAQVGHCVCQVLAIYEWSAILGDSRLDIVSLRIDTIKAGD